jgi:hypothetical protein
MSDFLTRLIQRHSGAMPTIQPRQPSRFAQDRAGLETDERRPTLVQQHEVFEPPSLLIPDNPAPVSNTEGNPPPIQPVRLLPESNQPRLTQRVQSIRDTPTVAPATPVEPVSFEDTQPLSIHPTAREMQTEQPQPMPQNSPHSGTNSPAVSTPVAQSRRPEPTLSPRLVPQREAQAMYVVRESSSAPTPLTSRTRMDREAGLLSREAAEPPVQVTIGRIEVSAVTATPSPSRKTPVRQPSMGLQEYLSRRQGRGT